MGEAADNEIDIISGPPYGPVPQRTIGWLKNLRESAPVLGDTERRDNLPLNELLTHEDKVGGALKNLLIMRQLVVLIPPENSEGEALFIESYSEPSAQQPFMHDRAGKKIDIDVFCGMVASGYDITVVAQ